MSRLFASSAVLAALVLAWLYHADAPLRAGLGLDAQHHIAAVRELARGEFPPRHNLVAQEGLPQGHYGPYLVLLGAVARWTGADPLHVLHAAGVGSLLAYVLVFRLAAERLVGSGAGRWAALAPLLLWGPWPGWAVAWPSWRWPGTTSLADAQNFFYPQQAGLILLLVTIVLVDSGLSTSRPGGDPRPRLAAAALVAALLVASHPLTGLALAAVLGAMALTLVVSRQATLGRLAVLGALPCAALALAALWPYYPVLRLLEAATLPGIREPFTGIVPAAGGVVAREAAPTVFSGVSSLLSILGPSVLGFWACLRLARRRQPFLLIWCLVDLALAFCPLLPLRHRFVFFAAMPLQLAAAGLLEEAWSRGRMGRALALALLAAGALSTGERTRWLLGQELPDLSFVARLTPDTAIVLSDLDTSNGVAGLAGRKVVAPQHPDLFLVAAGGWQRVLDVQRFLGRDTPAQDRDAIVRRWGASHVLIDRLSTRGFPELPYTVVYDAGGYVLYDVHGAAAQQ